MTRGLLDPAINVVQINPHVSRSTYCAVASAALLNLLSPELREGDAPSRFQCAQSVWFCSAGTAEFIARCQTFEGGIGGEPGNEAHGPLRGFVASAVCLSTDACCVAGGYTYCGLASLVLLGRVDAINLLRLIVRAMLPDSALTKHVALAALGEQSADAGGGRVSGTHQQARRRLLLVLGRLPLPTRRLHRSVRSASCLQQHRACE